MSAGNDEPPTPPTDSDPRPVNDSTSPETEGDASHPLVHQNNGTEECDTAV